MKIHHFIFISFFIYSIGQQTYGAPACLEGESHPEVFLWRTAFDEDDLQSSRSTVKRVSVLTQDKVCLKGIRLANDGAKPLLLIHGFMENLTIFNQVAQNLHKKGYDVYLFNMRGHGNNTTRSYPTLNHTLMGFDEIVAFDIPAMLRHISKQSKQKITILGHSMGTMSSRLTISGLTKKVDDDDLYISQKMKEYAIQNVEGVIALTSPSSFKNSNDIVRNFFKLDKQRIKNIRQTLLNILFYQRDVTSQNHSVFWRFINRYTNWITEKIVRYGVPRYFIDTLFKIENFDFSKFELSTLIHDSISVPYDLLYEDASRWSLNNNYASRGGNVLFENLEIPEQVPFYFIGVSEDGLANITDIRNDYNSQPSHPNMAMISIKGFGHMDIIATAKGRNIVTRIINNIFDNNFSKNALPILNIYPEIDVKIKD